MADSVDSLSNAEIRTKLSEYGFPVMPVTASTRKLMAKKLKMLIETKSKGTNSAPSAADRRSLAKYSSGEESDGERKIDKSKNRRATTAGTAMLPPSTNKVRRPTPKKELPPKKGSEKGSESEDEQTSPVRTLEEVETVTTRRITKTFQADKEDYETGSDSDVDGAKSDVNNMKSSSLRSDYLSNLPSSTFKRSPATSAYLPSRPLLSDYKTSSTTASDNLNSIRSRLGLTSPTLDRPSSSNYSSTYTSSFKPTSLSGTDETESPYLSSFTRRLSAMKAAESRNVLKESDVTNGNSTYTGRLYTSRANRPDSSDFKAVGERNIWKNNVVSFTLVGIFCLFFLIICFAYYGMKSDIAFILEDKANIIPICQVNVDGHDEGVSCILKEQSNHAMELLKQLYPELTRRAIAGKCSSTGGSPYMDNDDVVRFISSKYDNLAREKVLMDLFNLQVLVVNNPKWGLAVIEKQNAYKRDYEHNALSSMQEVLQNRKLQNTALLLLNPSLPMSCIFLNKLYSAFTYAIIFGLVCSAVYGLFRLRRYYSSIQKRKSDEVYSMVEQIIEVLSQDTGADGGDPYLPVIHVRDMLIAPQNREKVAGVWEAAVRFLERNESRVRFEVQVVDGEEFRVFRWLSPGSGSPRRSGAVWQGQAFETQEGSVNSLSISPTPCLKIRHMFDKDDSNPNLKTTIQDALLEKCLGKPNILHIDIDNNTGCVYVKCASPQDAGIVYRNLHGWWYEGNLITVKYLKLDRYMERFPLSPAMGPYLKPSGRKSLL